MLIIFYSLKEKYIIEKSFSSSEIFITCFSYFLPIYILTANPLFKYKFPSKNGRYVYHRKLSVRKLLPLHESQRRPNRGKVRVNQATNVCILVLFLVKFLSFRNDNPYIF